MALLQVPRDQNSLDVSGEDDLFQYSSLLDRGDTPEDPQLVKALGDHGLELQPLQHPQLRKRTVQFPETLVEDSDQSTNDPEKCNRRAPLSDRWTSWLTFADKWWLSELLAAFISIASFCALVYVLATSDESPQTTWLSGWLTLNSIVAILATSIKASMGVYLAAAISQQKWNRLSSFSVRGRQGQRIEEFELFDQASRGPWGSVKLLFGPTGLYALA